MSLIHKEAEKRLLESTFHGPGFVRLITEMAQSAMEDGQDSYHIAISFIEEDDTFIPGTYVPEVHLVLRKITDDDTK